MDRQPTLRGPRLTLRPLVREDFENLFAVASDPLIWELHPNPDRFRREVFEGFFEMAIESGGALAVIRHSDGRIVGSSRYYDFRETERDAVIGFTFLARACWGGSLNAELKALMLNHAFRYVNRVEFHVGPMNHRSKRALAKIGARSLGERDRPLPGGDTNRSSVFELTPEDLRAQRGLGFKLVIDVRTQTAKLAHRDGIIATYPVSTAAAGLGTEIGSNRTPMGTLCVESRIGDDAPLGAIFRGRVATGEVFSSVDPLPTGVPEDLVLTRILWLAGTEPRNANTLERFIYLHGTNQELLLGTPASHGCIRFKNTDIVDLYACASVGTLVEVID